MTKSFEDKFVADLSKEIEIQKYLKLMADAKYRLLEITKLCEEFDRLRKTTDDILFDSICLQIRKTIEIIAMSSLVSNKEAFENIQSNIERAWNGVEIIKEIERYTPHVFPIASYKYQKLSPNELAVSYQNLEQTTDVLNKDKFCDIYKKCGAALHTYNPYNEKQSVKQEILKNIPKWITLIFNTVAMHTICPYGFEHKRYFVYFGDLSNPNVYATRLAVI